MVIEASGSVVLIFLDLVAFVRSPLLASDESSFCSIGFSATTFLACSSVRLSQLTSARIKVASTWTVSPLTRPA